jgi:hypothetical protein
MGYVAAPYGIDAAWGSPLEPAWSPYQLVWLREPMELPRPMMVLTNNRFALASKETWSRTHMIGQATVPLYLSPEGKSIDQCNELAERLTGCRLDKDNPVLISSANNRGKLMKELFPLEEVLPKELDPDSSARSTSPTTVRKAIESLIGTISSAIHPREVYIPPKGVVTWLSPKYRFGAFDERWFAEQLDELQYIIWQEYQKNPERGVALHQAGYGILKKGEGKPETTEHPFPGMETKIGRNVTLKYLLNVRNYKYREERVAVLYSSIGAAMLRRFLNIKGYEREDYEAMNSVVHSMFSSYGALDFQNWLHAREITDSVMNTFGVGVRESDPIRGMDEGFFADLFDWALLFGLMNARTKPLADTIDVLCNSNMLRAYETVQFYYDNHVSLPAYGSKGDPHFLMARPTLQNDEFALPCAVRAEKHKPGAGGTWKDYPNTWEWYDVEKWNNVKNVRVEGADFNIPFEEYWNRNYYRFTFGSDGSTGKAMKGMTQRPVRYLKVPIWPFYATEDHFKPHLVRFLWFMNLMTSANTVLKDGMRIEPYFGALKGVNGRMRTYVDARGELRLEGEPKVVPTPGSQDTEGKVAKPEPREKPPLIGMPPEVLVDKTLDLGEGAEET